MKRFSYISQKGFGIAEIVLSLAVFLLVMVSVFQYSDSLYKGLKNILATSVDTVFPQGLDMFRYGELSCDFDTDIQLINSVDLSTILSTSTPVTSMHDIGDGVFIITTDSASTSEVDILKIRLNNDQVEILESIDVGPGIYDSVLLYPFLYVANTSINSHVKVLLVDTHFIELQNIRIPTLSLSASMPRVLSVFGDALVLGAEKSNTGGELFVLPIDENSLLGSTTHMIELNGQAHASRIFGTSWIITNSSDPEFRVFDHELAQTHIYDAPLTLGNGKSVLVMYPYVVLGRTLGSGELTLLDLSTSTIKALDIDRTNGTVDALELMDHNTFIALTSSAQKEIQFWKIKDAKLDFIHSINLPDRITSHTCSRHALYISTMIHEQSFILILK